jgi:hypothetical protein
MLGVSNNPGPQGIVSGLLHGGNGNANGGN